MHMKCFITDFNIRLDMDPITYGITFEILRKAGLFLTNMGENTCEITKGEGLKSLADLTHGMKLLVVALEEIDGLAKATYESLKCAKNPFDVPEKK